MKYVATFYVITFGIVMYLLFSALCCVAHSRFSWLMSICLLDALDYCARKEFTYSRIVSYNYELCGLTFTVVFKRWAAE